MKSPVRVVSWLAVMVLAGCEGEVGPQGPAGEPGAMGVAVFESEIRAGHAQGVAGRVAE